MNRRNFIGGTAAVVTATVIPALPDGVSLRSMAHPTIITNIPQKPLWPTLTPGYYGKSITEMLEVEIAQRRMNRIYLRIIDK